MNMCCVLSAELFSGWCPCCCLRWCGSSLFRSATRRVPHNRKVCWYLEWCCPSYFRSSSASATTNYSSKTGVQSFTEALTYVTFTNIHSMLQNIERMSLSRGYGVWLPPRDLTALTHQADCPSGLSFLRCLSRTSGSSWWPFGIGIRDMGVLQQ